MVEKSHHPKGRGDAFGLYRDGKVQGPKITQGRWLLYEIVWT